MAKRFSLSSIIKPDESEYVDASQLEAGLTDAYEPVISGSALHARPLPVTMYTVDEDSEQFPDAPLGRAPMRITRRYVPSNPDNKPLLTSKERPEFPLFNDQKQQVDSGIAYPRAEEKYTKINQFQNESNQDTIYHDFESEAMNDFVAADPNVIGLMKKTGMSVPTEVTLSAKLKARNRAENNPDRISASQRMRESPRLYVPDSMSKNPSGVKKKITI